MTAEINPQQRFAVSLFHCCNFASGCSQYFRFYNYCNVFQVSWCFRNYA